MYDILLEKLLKIRQNELKKVMPSLVNTYFYDVIEEMLTSAKYIDDTMLKMTENEYSYVV